MPLIVGASPINGTTGAVKAEAGLVCSFWMIPTANLSRVRFASPMRPIATAWHDRSQAPETLFEVQAVLPEQEDCFSSAYNGTTRLKV